MKTKPVSHDDQTKSKLVEVSVGQESPKWGSRTRTRERPIHKTKGDELGLLGE